MTKCRGELQSQQSELQFLRKDVSVKTSQIGHMEKSLQLVKRQLESKSDTGMTYIFKIWCDAFIFKIYPLLLVSLIHIVPLAPSSGGSRGEAPSLRGRSAQLCPAGPHPGGSAAGGTERAGWDRGAATRTAGRSAENTNHRRRAASLSG